MSAGLRKYLSLFDLSHEFLQSLTQYIDVSVKFEQFQSFSCFKHLEDVGGVSLDSFDPHVVVHPLLHESSFCKGFGRL